MIRVRFAPSPTGKLQLGNIRTALINWVFARQNKGFFLLRLDDTDAQRSQEVYAEGIKTDLSWLGLTWDAEDQQSKRTDAYTQVVEQLTELGYLYPCYETPEELQVKRDRQQAKGKPPIYDRAALDVTNSPPGRRPHWRFLVQPGRIQWTDLVRGPVSFDSKHLSDPILVREDGSFNYLLSSVVDDIEWKITHIIRGEDHVTNTALQLQLFKALSGTIPTFAHLPLLHDSHGEKISKRAGEAFSVEALRAQGMLPTALCSMLVSLGTGKASQFCPNVLELTQHFDIEAYGRASPCVEVPQLWSTNRTFLQTMEWQQICTHLPSDLSLSPEVWGLIRDTVSSLLEVEKWIGICSPNWKAHGEFPKDLQPDDLTHCLVLRTCKDCLPQEPWNADTVKQWIQEVQKITGIQGKALYFPLRLALTGQEHGPNLQEFINWLGYSNVSQRLKDALGEGE